MAFEAVDACFGTPHISSEDLAALNEATIGESDCVMEWGDDFKATMSSANACLIGTGVGMVGGRRFWNKAAVSLTVASGTQGQKRNDLVVARYTKKSDGTESIDPVVIKGTATTGTPADPSVTANDLKLWRIPIEGVSVGTPVALFTTVAPLANASAVVARGTSGVWTYAKYSDGTAECSANWAVSASISDSYAGVYYRWVTPPSFPFAFAEDPCVVADCSCGSGLVWVSAVNTEKDECGVLICSAASNSEDRTLRLQAKGKWR